MLPDNRKAPGGESRGQNRSAAASHNDTANHPHRSGPRRRVIEVDLDRYRSVVRGWGSRELVVDLTGRAPMFVRSVRGWSVSEETARNVVAAAEARGWDIVISGPRATAAVTPPAILPEAPREHPDPAGGLW